MVKTNKLVCCNKKILFPSRRPVELLLDNQELTIYTQLLEFICLQATKLSLDFFIYCYLLTYQKLLRISSLKLYIIKRLKNNWSENVTAYYTVLSASHDTSTAYAGNKSFQSLAFSVGHVGFIFHMHNVKRIRAF